MKVLQAGFGRGAAFFQAWQAWRADPARPALLHFVGLTAAPCAADALGTDAAGAQALAAELAADWQGLTPGFHRFAFEGGRVLLTLCVGPLQPLLREQDFRADALRLGEEALQAWEPDMAKALARLAARGCTLDADACAPGIVAGLQACGWQVEAQDGPLRARYAPPWTVKGAVRPTVPEAGRATVIGAGLAGAAVAANLARRGWSVLVLDAGDTPATGASQLPAGLLAPHQSPDDNVLSRLSRAGVRITLREARAHLARGLEWEPTGALEWRGSDLRPLPAVDGLAPWSREASATQKHQAGWDAAQAAWWHENAAWIEPAALVRAWLRTPGVRFAGDWRVAGIVHDGAQWRVDDISGARTALSPLVVVAAASGSADLLPMPLPLHPVRGQVTWGSRPEDGRALPPFPVNGHGHFLPHVPLVEGGAWITGSTYGRGDADPGWRAGDDAANLQRAGELLPGAATTLAGSRTRAWSGVRCTSSDRRPLVGEVQEGLWVSTAMGSRGLSFAALCAELLAARLHQEPLPLPLRLAQALDARRVLR